jgi:hypothetical protein
MALSEDASRCSSREPQTRQVFGRLKMLTWGTVTLQKQKEKKQEYVRGEGIKKDWHFYCAFFTMSFITLIAALDATMISVALPVSY